MRNIKILTLLAISLTATNFGRLVSVQAQPVSEHLTGTEQTEWQHYELRQTLPANPASRDSLVEVRILDVRTYMDTIRTIEQREESLVIPADSSDRRGHYLQAHIGAAIGNVGYGGLKKDYVGTQGNQQAALSGAVQLQYAYFFHRNVGIGIGAWLSNYTSYGNLSGEQVFNGLKQVNGRYVPDTGSGIIDSEGEYYNHHATIRRWRERQTLHTVGVPVSLQFQAWGKTGKTGLFVALGAAPVYSVHTTYRVLEGEIEHWGAYLHMADDANIHDVQEFGTIDYVAGTITQLGKSSPYSSAGVHTDGKLNVKQFSATAIADIGLLIRLSKQVDLLLGVYAHYTFLDMQNAQLKDLGWQDNVRFPNLKMEQYDGMLATNCLADNGALRPWQAGVKIGVHWHSLGKPRTESVLLSDTTLQLVARHDSVRTERIDTFERKILTKVQRVQRKINELNRIYFEFDNFRINKESQQMLMQIAEELKTIPNKVLIGGHASKEGLRSHNARLAKLRATEVKYFLMDCGIPSKRIIAKDYGSDVENAINIHHELPLDRRVEIIVQEQ